MKYRKLFIVVSLLMVVAGFMLGGCSFSEAIQGGVEESNSTTAKTGEAVTTALTGNPVLGKGVGFLLGLGLWFLEKRGHKKTRRVAETMAEAIEVSPDKVAIAVKVKKRTEAEGLLGIVNKIVRKVTK